MRVKLAYYSICLLVISLMHGCVSQNKQTKADQSSAHTQENAQAVPHQDPAKNQMVNSGQSRKECGDIDGSYYRLNLALQNSELGDFRVGATGHGAPPKYYYPDGQRRLMTMRASKVDAYRALAEVVGGLHIWGGTTISDMVVEKDRYRTFIDTYVRGARVISVDAGEDETYTTVVELNINDRFLWQILAFVDPSTAKYCFKKSNDGAVAYYGNSNVVSTFYYSE